MDNLVYYAVLAVILLILLYGGMFLFKALQKRARRHRQGDRLGIVEVLDVDELRQLVLVRRDDTEHLLLVGGDNDLVVESGINVTDMGVTDMGHAREEEPLVAPPPRRRMPFAPRRPAATPAAPSDETMDEAGELPPVRPAPHAEPRVTPPLREVED